jgi:uncharacterized membrane protein
MEQFWIRGDTMDVFNEILLMLHFMGLGAGSAAAIGNFAVMLTVNKSPAQDAPTLTRVQPYLTRAGDIGLGLLWITGIIMVFTRWGGPGNLPTAFWWKLLFVVLLTIVVGLMHMMLGKVKRDRDMAAAARLPLFGRIASLCLILVTVFAVVAFN